VGWSRWITWRPRVRRRNCQKLMSQACDMLIIPERTF
jgi:hypothetical protein